MLGRQCGDADSARALCRCGKGGYANTMVAMPTPAEVAMQWPRR